MTSSAVDLAGHLGLPPPTPEQQAAIEAPLGPAVVIAGAGSGKTETMAARVVWLVANQLVAAENILGLTFTRKAAAELSQRVRRRLAAWRRSLPPDETGAGPGEDPTVLTYAAYAQRLVVEHGLRIGVEPSARLISPAVSWQLADAVMRGYDGDLPAEIGAPSSVTGYVQDLAGQLADHLRTAVDVRDLETRLRAAIAALGPGPQYGDTIGALEKSLAHRSALLPMVEAYAAAKQAAGAVDFADQMVAAAELARQPEVATAERDRFGAVLLDEYQDTGFAQIAMLRGLFGAGHPVTAVGDPVQSIYSWRGASAGNIVAFDRDFPGRDAPIGRYPLSTSFRNDRAVLTVANAVSGPLRGRDDGTVELRAADAAGPGRVLVAFTETNDDEAAWLAARMREEWDALAADGDRARTGAVLVRRRREIPRIVEALLAAGLPVEVVTLGGLLGTPEVMDVVATLQVLADRDAGKGLLRVLTGARWRIGPRDLQALNRRADRLANPGERGADGPRERGSIVEALDDLGDPDRYSSLGFARLSQLAEELRGLRRRLSAPLPELVADVERTLGLDVEVAARRDRQRIRRRHLDRFLDEAARFALEADQATLGAFMAYLTAAEDQEYGLDAGDVEVDPERIQVLTVHGAKGLEWDVVAVPALGDGIFPSQVRGDNWTTSRQRLPYPLRGDRDDLPEFNPAGCTTRQDLKAELEAFKQAVADQHLDEERRLAYVAVTRARHTLLASGFAWDTGLANARLPSPFLLDLRPAAEVQEWFTPADGATNPLDDQNRAVLWPIDPLGGRRAEVERAAALVRAAAEDPQPLLPTSQRWVDWQRDVDVLLAEHARRDAGTVEVALPGQLSVSALVALQADADDFARRLRRPLPQAPAPLARRGTAFHLWLEQRWAGDRLLDVDELPGAADADAAADTDLEMLRAAFEASGWADRVPAEVEVPFEMVVAGTVIRGRMDAVFRDPDDPGPDDAPRWLVVDWKTGAVPTGARKRAVAVQLAAYRMAWAALQGIADADIGRVRAGFQYVRDDEFVEPADLLDAARLRALITG